MHTSITRVNVAIGCERGCLPEMYATAYTNVRNGTLESTHNPLFLLNSVRRVRKVRRICMTVFTRPREMSSSKMPAYCVHCVPLRTAGGNQAASLDLV